MTDEQKKSYASLYVLKMMDLDPKDGGRTFPVVLPSELAPLDEILQDLAVADLVRIDQKKGIYTLTPEGLDFLAETIDEAEDLVEEFDEHELEDTLAELRARKLDVFRARFLWGWFEGEFDDLVAWQERRGVTPVERLWAFYLVSDDFYRELARDLEA